jgi:hypothetical protein
MRARSAASKESFDAKLAAVGKPPHFGDGPIPDFSGQEIYNAMIAREVSRVRDMPGSRLDNIAGSDPSKAASEALRKAGIPGLKYYDQMSRPVSQWEVVKHSDGWQLKNHQFSSSQWEVFGKKTAADEALSKKAGTGTRNYVTWDQDVLNRMKLLERDGETFAMGGSPLAAAPLALEQQRPALTPEMLRALQLADPNGA